MKKCIDCAYFLNCKKANEEEVCEKYRYIQKNIEIKEGIENLIAEYYFYTHTHWMYLPTVFLLNTEKGFLVSSYISSNLPKFYKQEVLTSLRFSRICICKEYYWLWLSFSPHTNMA